MKSGELGRARNDNVPKRNVSLTVNSHIYTEAMDDFAIGSDISG